ncbi:MAG: hypothetical protein KDK34_24925 [Leptospiraceae bacterium]|nr:hypothetical protein [Leptospiraceae bacterium]
MKRILFLLVALFLSFQALAGDNYNGTTSVYSEGHTYVVYKFTGTFTGADSTGNWYSKGMFIGDANDSDGYVQVTLANSASGTEDVNGFIEYSYDGVTWTAGATDANLDAISTTTINDTLGIAGGADQLLFHNSNLMRVKLDGQAGNPQTTWTVYVTLKKDPVYDRRPDNIGKIIRY